MAFARARPTGPSAVTPVSAELVATTNRATAAAEASPSRRVGAALDLPGRPVTTGPHAARIP